MAATLVRTIPIKTLITVAPPIIEDDFSICREKELFDIFEVSLEPQKYYEIFFSQQAINFKKIIFVIFGYILPCCITSVQRHLFFGGCAFDSEDHSIISFEGHLDRAW
jgi:hypothetical protein